MAKPTPADQMLPLTGPADSAQTTRTGSPEFPQLSDAIQHTSRSKIDQAIADLKSGAEDWPSVAVRQRINMVNKIRTGLYDVREEWITASMNAKGIRPNSQGEGEEWLVLTMLFRLLNVLERSLNDIRKTGKPKIPGGLRQDKQGRITARSFPQTLVDQIFYSFVTGDIVFPEGMSEDHILSNQAANYSAVSKGSICLVLAAGNLSVLSVIDFIYKLFVENQVVIVKTNPVNDYVNPFIEKAFAPLIEGNFLKIIHGGPEEGKFLCEHPQIEELHLTGSDKTFDAIVFGNGETGARNKASRQPISKKRFTAELGNITPVIVVPGPWSESDIQSQAVKLASWFSVNAGFNCITPRLMIQHKNWSKRNALNTAIVDNLKTVETRVAYYPGAQDRHKMFMDQHPDAAQIGQHRNGHLPWTFITDVNHQQTDDICFKNEPFCSLLSETAMKADSVAEFVDQAVDFANQHIWGSLAAVVLVHPSSLKDPEVKQAVERALANLKYGSVCLNLRAEFAYMLMTTPWGAYPGHDLYDIQSGIGRVNNLLMFQQPEKTIVRGPFKPFPDPFSIRSSTIAEFGRKFAEFEANPKAWKIPGLIYTALRGYL